MEYNFECWYKDVCSSSKRGCRNNCARYNLIVEMCLNSNIPKNRWYSNRLTARDDLDAFKRLNEIKLDILNWVNLEDETNNLYIYSQSTGNGKTSWAVKLMLAYFNKIWKFQYNNYKTRGVFVSVPKLICMIKKEMKPDADNEQLYELMSKIEEADLVIWDDMGASKETPYVQEQLLSLIDGRVFSSKANIYTSNCSEYQLEEKLNERLFSRIFRLSEKIIFRSNDARGFKLGRK